MDRPAKHTKNAQSDKEAIDQLSLWIDKSRLAVPLLNSYDTFPNYDGTIELKDIDGYPKGDFKAQVKKLANKMAGTSYTFKDGKFLAYCRENASWMPIIFIGVNLEKECAYWLHISKELLETIGDSRTVTFPQGQIITATDTGYIQGWRQVIELYAGIAAEREKLKSENTRLLSQITSNLISETDDKFVFIHRFLDELNSSLDNELDIVKKVYYPNAWKLGLAYADYRDELLAYSLYPVAANANDVQIKKLNPDTSGEIMRGTFLGSTWHLNANPIKDGPEQYAQKLLKKHVDRIVKERLLDYSGSAALATEYMFGYIDEYAEQMGLPQKDNYTFKEVEYGFHQYLPRWLYEAGEILLKYGNHPMLSRHLHVPGVIGTYSPEWIRTLMPQQRQDIKDAVSRKIKEGKPMFGIAIEPQGGLSPVVFAKMLHALREKKVKNIRRVFKPRDPSYLSSIGSAMVWDLYRPEDRAYNIREVMRNLSEAYNSVVENNFPKLQIPHTILRAGHQLYVVYNPDTPTSGLRPPNVRCYEVASKSGRQGAIKFMLTTEHEILDQWRDLSVDGKTFKVARSYGLIHGFWSARTPLLDTVYWYLEEALKDYFKS